MITIGLTGSIGMGKSTVAGMFRTLGAAVWDADEAVHRLYAAGGAGARAIEALAPGAVVDGAVSRPLLREAVLADRGLLSRIEAMIHPLVAEDRAGFLEQAEADGAAAAVCDIPLLFETGGDAAFDHVVVVSAPAEAQRERVLARPGMTETSFEAILSKQTPDAEKRARADFIIDTGATMEATREQVEAVLAQILGEMGDA